ncbi:MAG: hypothetical protein KGJ11_01790, partial [Candidatus Omnitrophica bacterium]|nr:hypothetical protein [Candidatus Omnitrophota bacterium]
ANSGDAVQAKNHLVEVLILEMKARANKLIADKKEEVFRRLDTAAGRAAVGAAIAGQQAALNKTVVWGWILSINGLQEAFEIVNNGNEEKAKGQLVAILFEELTARANKLITEKTDAITSHLNNSGGRTAVEEALAGQNTGHNKNVIWNWVGQVEAPADALNVQEAFTIISGFNESKAKDHALKILADEIFKRSIGDFARAYKTIIENFDDVQKVEVVLRALALEQELAVLDRSAGDAVSVRQRQTRHQMREEIKDVMWKWLSPELKKVIIGINKVSEQDAKDIAFSIFVAELPTAVIQTKSSRKARGITMLLTALLTGTAVKVLKKDQIFPPAAMPKGGITTGVSAKADTPVGRGILTRVVVISSAVFAAGVAAVKILHWIFTRTHRLPVKGPVTSWDPLVVLTMGVLAGLSIYGIMSLVRFFKDQRKMERVHLYGEEWTESWQKLAVEARAVIEKFKALRRGQTAGTMPDGKSENKPANTNTPEQRSLNIANDKPDAGTPAETAQITAKSTQAAMPETPAAAVAQQILNNIHNLAPPVQEGDTVVITLSQQKVEKSLQFEVAKILKNSIEIKAQKRDGTITTVPADQITIRFASVHVDISRTTLRDAVKVIFETASYSKTFELMADQISVGAKNGMIAKAAIGTALFFVGVADVPAASRVWHMLASWDWVDRTGILALGLLGFYVTCLIGHHFYAQRRDERNEERDKQKNGNDLIGFCGNATDPAKRAFAQGIREGKIKETRIAGYKIDRRRVPAELKQFFNKTETEFYEFDFDRIMADLQSGALDKDTYGAMNDLQETTIFATEQAVDGKKKKIIRKVHFSAMARKVFDELFPDDNPQDKMVACTSIDVHEAVELDGTSHPHAVDLQKTVKGYRDNGVGSRLERLQDLEVVIIPIADNGIKAENVYGRIITEERKGFPQEKLELAFADRNLTHIVAAIREIDSHIRRNPLTWLFQSRPHEVADIIEQVHQALIKEQGRISPTTSVQQLFENLMNETLSDDQIKKLDEWGVDGAGEVVKVNKGEGTIHDLIYKSLDEGEGLYFIPLIGNPSAVYETEVRRLLGETSRPGALPRPGALQTILNPFLRAIRRSNRSMEYVYQYMIQEELPYQAGFAGALTKNSFGGKLDFPKIFAAAAAKGYVIAFDHQKIKGFVNPRFNGLDEEFKSMVRTDHPEYTEEQFIQIEAVFSQTLNSMKWAEAMVFDIMKHCEAFIQKQEEKFREMRKDGKTISDLQKKPLEMHSEAHSVYEEIAWELIMDYSYRFQESREVIQQHIVSVKLGAIQNVIKDLIDYINAREGMSVLPGLMNEQAALYLGLARQAVEKIVNGQSDYLSYRRALNEAVDAALNDEQFERGILPRMTVIYESFYINIAGKAIAPDQLADQVRLESRRYFENIADYIVQEADRRIREKSVQIDEDAKVIILFDRVPTPIEFSNILGFYRQTFRGALNSKGSVRTSHYSNVAKSARKPLLNIRPEDKGSFKKRQLVLISRGKIYINPDHETRQQARAAERMQKAYERYCQVLAKGSAAKAGANADTAEEFKTAVIQYGAGFIGLRRSENGYETIVFRSKREQEIKDEAMYENAQGRNSTARFIDYAFANDKKPLCLEHIEYSGEKGCLEHPLVWALAVEQAVSWGKISNKETVKSFRAMFPMIETVEDFDRALGLVAEAMNSAGLDPRGFMRQIGSMLETPQALANMELLMQKVLFFSVGTNDLIAKLYKVDRSNPNQSASYYKNVRVWATTLIRQAVGKSNDEGVDISICGDLAAMKRFWFVWHNWESRGFEVGLSMPAPMIPEFKAWIKVLKGLECPELDQINRAIDQALCEMEAFLAENHTREEILAKDGELTERLNKTFDETRVEEKLERLIHIKALRWTDKQDEQTPQARRVLGWLPYLPALVYHHGWRVVLALLQSDYYIIRAFLKVYGKFKGILKFIAHGGVAAWASNFERSRILEQIPDLQRHAIIAHEMTHRRWYAPEAKAYFVEGKILLEGFTAPLKAAKSILHEQVIPLLNESHLEELATGQVSLTYDPKVPYTVFYITPDVLAINLKWLENDGTINALRTTFFYHIILNYLENTPDNVIRRSMHMPAGSRAGDKYFSAGAFDSSFLRDIDLLLIEDRLKKVLSERAAYRLSFDRELIAIGIQRRNRGSWRRVRGRPSRTVVLEIAARAAIAEATGYAVDEDEDLKNLLGYALRHNDKEYFQRLKEELKKFYLSIEFNNEFSLREISLEEFRKMNPLARLAYVYSYEGLGIIPPGMTDNLRAALEAAGRVQHQYLGLLAEMPMIVYRWAEIDKRDLFALDAIKAVLKTMGVNDKDEIDRLSTNIWKGQWDNIRLQEEASRLPGSDIKSESEIVPFKTTRQLRETWEYYFNADKTPAERAQDFYRFYKNIIDAILNGTWTPELYKKLWEETKKILEEFRSMAQSAPEGSLSQEEKAKTILERIFAAKPYVPASSGLFFFKYIHGGLSIFDIFPPDSYLNNIYYTLRGIIEKKSTRFEILFQAYDMRSRMLFLKQHGWVTDKPYEQLTIEEKLYVDGIYQRVSKNEVQKANQRLRAAGMPADTRVVVMYKMMVEEQDRLVEKVTIEKGLSLGDWARSLTNKEVVYPPHFDPEHVPSSKVLINSEELFRYVLYSLLQKSGTSLSREQQELIRAVEAKESFSEMKKIIHLPNGPRSGPSNSGGTAASSIAGAAVLKG